MVWGSTAPNCSSCWRNVSRGWTRRSSTYQQVIEQAQGKPVVFRTLDIGADKILPYLRQPKEENPAMGWRSIRMSMERPGLLRLQVRAMLMAGAGHDMKVMFPMIADVSEYLQAKTAVDKEKDYLARSRTPLPKSLADWRDDRNSVADLAAGPIAAAGGFCLDWLQRPCAIPVCVGPSEPETLWPL